MDNFIPSIGVEEEYQLVDPESGRLLPNCKRVIEQIGQQTAAEIQHELHLTQIEMASKVCKTLDEVRQNVRHVRGVLIVASQNTDTALVAAGTNPLPVPASDSFTPKRRYQVMSQRFQQIARDMLIFGCHVHVSIKDRLTGLRVMNRCRRWLPILQALSANSPYWDGEDTGYASYRRELWAQWPMAGPPPHFDDLADYRACVNDLVRSGAIKDESFIYWDIRLPTKVPTIEFRGADVMLSVEETVGYAGLVRAIVMQAMRDIQSNRITRPIRSSLLSYATWHAARYGISEDLVDPLSCEKRPAKAAVLRLLEEVRPALEITGDLQCVHEYVHRLFDRGTGADRQRGAAGPDGDVRRIVHHAIGETARDAVVSESSDRRL
ncbi:Carboxylate-amine ligase YbdK [Stieleria neptunia]|uniref:Putative glutamate--cysteine ligase 2 n=1 Tax=Stieleria neptunia TaxID=2527979 RepID=A0A518HXI7_9BACT|nr:glutamate--cysteine ligase [Stieleria neptunia]QDV45578.1 Carboxylate-amine ligase YbdK [Stieleria neptunia]